MVTATKVVHKNVMSEISKLLTLTLIC